MSVIKTVLNLLSAGTLFGKIPDRQVRVCEGQDRECTARRKCNQELILGLFATVVPLIPVKTRIPFQDSCRVVEKDG